MPSAAFTTLGCKVNQYETQKILESFEEKGFQIVPFDQLADLYVINSCSVTSQAESKSRYTARKAARTNPEGIVVMTGCAGQMSINQGAAMEDVHLLVPNPQKLETINFVVEKYGDLVDAAQNSPSKNLTKPAERTRATVKVQDGCNIFCSYCSIPFTRPVRSSRLWTEVVSEVEALAIKGFKEIVLTGVLIGNYGHETGSGGPDFPELIELLAAIEGIERIRISSIETTDVTPKLIETISRTPKVCPHLHIPLQSGDDGVLKAMNRPYTQHYYLSLCRDLRVEIPHLSITTDIMVGFPGEDDAAFSQTCKVVEEVNYLEGHIFRFSPRPSTPAERMKTEVTDPKKDERSKHLMKLCKESGLKASSRFIGRINRVLVERKQSQGGLMNGLTDHYLKIQFTGPESLGGEFAHVMLQEVSGEGNFGELVSVNSSRTPLQVLN